MTDFVFTVCVRRGFRLSDSSFGRGRAVVSCSLHDDRLLSAHTSSPLWALRRCPTTAVRLAAPCGSGKKRRLHRLRVPWLALGFTTLPLADIERGQRSSVPAGRLLSAHTHPPLWGRWRWPAIAVGLAAPLGGGDEFHLHRLRARWLSFDFTAPWPTTIRTPHRRQLELPT